jgi:hypothetical protein
MTEPGRHWCSFVRWRQLKNMFTCINFWNANHKHCCIWQKWRSRRRG